MARISGMTKQGAMRKVFNHMEPTQLHYLEDMHVMEYPARVLAVEEIDGRIAVILNQTILYAQGGGQPADHGYIKSAAAQFAVTDVRFKDGVVYHFGTFVGGAFIAGDEVVMSVDAGRRQLHKRLHSAAHIYRHGCG